MASRTISDFVRSLPKTEIHVHSEATVSFESYFSLNAKYHVDTSLRSPADFRKILEMDSLSVMIKNFLYLQTFFRSAVDFELVVHDVRAYAERNSIRYMETYVAPSMVLRQGYIDFADMMDPLVDGFTKLAAEGGPDIRIIVDVSRSFGKENAARNLNFLLGYLGKRRTDRILGIGLGGSEAGNPCIVYKDVFHAAKEAGLHVVAHAGEEVGPESITDAIVELGAERIGHGTSAIQDPKLMDMMKERSIAFEICPKSNIITGKYVKRYEDHPIKDFYDRGLLVTINTDDPVLFDIELDDEYVATAAKLRFNAKTILDIMRNGITASFMGEQGKKDALSRLEKAALAMASG